GYANTVTLSQSGDTYTFTTDSADVITAITNAPKDYKYRVKGLGKTVVEITSVDASIASITFNLGDRDDAVRVNSARDGLASVTTTGAQSYLGDLWLEANVRLQSSGVVTLGGYVDGARSVSVTAGGMLVHGAVGDTVPLTSLSVSVGQALEIATSLETTGDILLSVHDAPSSGQDIVLQAGSSLSSSGGTIALLAGDNIDLRLGSSLSAAGQLTLSGDYGDADPGVGSIVGVSGVLIAGGAALTGGNDDDVFDIDDNAAAEGGSLAHLFAALAVTGGGGTDVLRLNDSGRTDPTHVTLTSTSIGAGPDDTWFAAGIPVTYTGIEDLQMATGAGADMVDVVSTHPGNTRIDTGPGADQLIIRSNSGVTSLSTGDGDDTTRVFVPADAASLLGGTLAISAGGSTNDVLLLDGSGFTTSVQIELSADQVTGLSAVPVAYQGVGQLQIRLGTGTDLTEIISTHAGHTTVDAGSGADRFYVRSTSGPTLILAGDDSDFVRVSSLDATLSGINGLLELRAGVDDNDILALDDSGSALGATVQLDSETITGLGSTAIVYRDVDYLQVSLGTGDDVVDVVSTHRGETLVDTGAGADEIAVTSTDGVTRLLSATGNDAIRIGSPDVGLAAMRGEIDVSAGNGSQDRLVLDDRSATVAASIVMSASAVLGAAPAPIHFDTTEALELYLGSGGDVVEIDSTHAGATLLDAGGGQDQVFVRATDGVSALHAGPEGATIYVGSPTADVADLRGLLQVDGASGGPTILIVDDSGNTAGRTVELTSNRLEGLSPAPIEYRAISDLLIQFGSGDDVVTVAGTHEGTTTLLMNAGNDVVIGRSTDGATSVDGGAGLQDLLQAGNEVADTVVLSAAALVLSAQGVELARLSYVDDTFERFDLTTDNGGDNTYSVTLGAEAGANGPGKFGFDPGLPGTGKTISLTDYSGFNVLSFADSRGGVRFDASLLDGTPQTVDAAGSRLQVAGNFQRFVGSAYDDELFAPTAELQIGTDPANPFNLAPILTGFGSDATRAQLGELLGSFGASMSPSELGSLLGAFGNALSAEQLGDLLGAFRRTVVAGAGDDLVGGGLFGTYDLGSGNNRFIQAETAPVADSLLRSFAGGAPLQTADLGAVLGGFRVEVTAGNGDDAVEAGILASLDLGGGSNQFVQSQSAGELIGLGQFLVQTTDSAATGQWGTLFNGLAGTTSSDVAATVLSAFAGAIGLTEVGTLLGGFGAGTTNLAQLGGLVGGFGNAAAPSQLAALGQLLGGFGGSLTGPQLGSLLGGFGAAASPAALGPVLGGFGSAVTASQLGALAGGFGTSVTAEQLGRLLGGFGTGLSATQLGSLLGGFGGAVRSAD
ncbi:MAG: hypothetical protein MUF48_23970, partial [Pirellulaceae bacterium]|nr:hypothetical protein [Pirellulaceae bacterium]